MGSMDTPAIVSLLDTDMYKFTMQYAVFRCYNSVDVEYEFHNRSPEMKLNQAGLSWLRKQIDLMSLLRVTADELDFLKKSNDKFSQEYLAYLRLLELDPTNQVFCGFNDQNELSIQIRGKWVDVIMWEVPLLLLTSQAYFMFVDTDWNYKGQREKACRKSKILVDHNCVFSEFGTRRRRDLKTQIMVMEGILSANPGSTFTGTSNVHLAHKFGLKPIGTVAHEWTMGIAALMGTYAKSNFIALEKWAEIYGDSAGIALPDTFGTDAFLKDFNKETALKFSGVRQDSGDPSTFVIKMSKFYAAMGIDTQSKTIVFSDGLDTQKVIELKQSADHYNFKSFFGIGTFFTNDFTNSHGDKSKPMNIVIKLSKAGDRFAIKLSDESAKHTGDVEEVRRAKEDLAWVGKS